MHKILTETKLRAPVLWENEIGEPVLEILAAHEKSDGKMTAREYRFKAAGLLASRKFKSAERALSHVPDRPDLILWRIYYLCLGKEFTEATVLANKHQQWLLADPTRRKFMEWLSKVTRFEAPQWLSE